VYGWLGVNTGSASMFDTVLRKLIKAFEVLPIDALITEMSPSAAMTKWLAIDEAPDNFTIDNDTELRSNTESKATVRYVRHTLEHADMQHHIEAGKRCTRLAMTWNDRVSFVLSEGMTIKSIAPLDIINETISDAANEIERAEGDLILMTGEFRRMLTDIVVALGGEAKAVHE